tara:strand:+ start:7633 stop:8520 length:888 start_codon:yes stop_codon:yes gene_type:complete
MALKIAFGMIVFEGDYVLKECLESVYPYATQILISEGPVRYWQDKGFTTSTDKTNDILHSFPDPENKITIVHGQFEEKDEECRAYMPYLKDDIDYIWNLDSDEIFKGEDIEKLVQVLEEEKYTSVGVRSCSFYGGFDHYIGGFEQMPDNFLRIFKVYPGANWLTHRPPTIIAPEGVETLPDKHLDSETLWEKHGVQMYHYSYVFPTQVKNKLEYYKAKVSMQHCHPNYFNEIFLPWIAGNKEVEQTWKGVHEFNPGIRMHSFTEKFTGSHPEAIVKGMPDLKRRLDEESRRFLEE